MTTWSIDEICKRTTRSNVLKALHACREGHPWNTLGTNHWLNAWVLALQDRNIPLAACTWLERRGDEWNRDNERAA